MFPQCNGENCISLEYAIITTPDDKTGEPDWVKNAITFVKDKSKLPSSTFKKYQKPITTLPELKEYYENYQKHPNITQIGVVFCGSKVPSPDEQR